MATIAVTTRTSTILTNPDPLFIAVREPIVAPAMHPMLPAEGQR
ncbi:hypothetical protein SBADM41S_02774 [Streptomyces badius]